MKPNPTHTGMKSKLERMSEREYSHLNPVGKSQGFKYIIPLSASVYFMWLKKENQICVGIKSIHS